MAYIRSGFLTDNIEEYTKFRFDGYQIQLPYYWGGKESASTIRANLSTLCGGSGSGKTEAQIQAIATDNETLCGVDCSGFVLRTTNEACSSNDGILDYFSEIAHSISSGFPIDESAEVRYRWGISSEILTSSEYSSIITGVTNIKVGDFIRFDDGAHIGVVKSITNTIQNGQLKYIITYAHSSGGKGPHEASITLLADSVIEMATLNLSAGSWNDWNSSYSATIKNLFNYVCRPNCLD